MLATLPLLLSLSGCRTATEPPLNVIVVVIDGIRTDDGFSETRSELTGLPGKESLPLIHELLVPQGTLVQGVRNYGTTTTAPAHAILMTGRRTPLANFANDFGAGSYRPLVPTWIEAARAQHPDEQAMVLANQSLIEPMTWSLHPEGGQTLGAEWAFVPEEPGSIQPAGEDAPAFAQLSRLLSEQHPTYVMVNLKAVDRTGHYAPELDGYLKAIEDVDAPLVTLWEQLQLDPFYAGNTLLVVTSDHGRHRSDYSTEEEYWRNHGNSSTGDRDIPLLLIGPGVPAGKVVEGPWALQDVAPTIAALAGVDLPWAEGLPISEAMESAPESPRQGVSRTSRIPALQERFLTDDPAHRSAVFVGDLQLSDPDSRAAEAPVGLELGGQQAVCWRELVDWDITLPWVPRCALLQDGALVSELPAPEAEVGPFWRPAMATDAQGRLCLSYPYNPDDIASAGIDNSVAIRHACLEGGDWVQGVNTDDGLLYPELHSAALLDDGRVLLPLVASPPNNEARDRRRVYLQTGHWQGSDWVFEGTQPVDLADAQPLSGSWRLAWPTLQARDGALELLVLSRGDESTQLLRVTSTDGGESWSSPEILAASPALSLQHPPVFWGGEAAWVVQDQLCTASGCEPLGGRVRDIVSDGEVLRVVTETAPGAWEVVELQAAVAQP
ncbi:MAG: alkaline phosphatase family protein [Myxococcota bacterium]|nr:alkaline phosphatase family protein [Myxococcota bacterium]